MKQIYVFTIALFSLTTPAQQVKAQDGNKDTHLNRHDDADDGDMGKWGLLGLIGLVGLAGLRKKDDREITVRTPRTDR
jgi:MYXO-CTERM domain-containing protein